VSDESCSLSFVSSLGSQESQSVSGDENSGADHLITEKSKESSSMNGESLSVHDNKAD